MNNIPALEITARIGCSNNCSCCPQTKLILAYNKISTYTEMQLEDFKQILSHVPKDVMILFSGFCEIFLNKHAADMMVYANTEGYKIALYTTLVGSKEKDIEKIKDIPFVSCTIHVPDNKYFVFDNKKWTKKYESFAQLGIKHTTLALGYTNVNIKKSPCLIIPHSRAGSVGILTNNVHHKGPIGCNVGNGIELTNNVVLPNGDVVICCMNYDIDHYMGNLYHQTWEEIHSEQPYHILKQLLIADDSQIICRKCHVASKLKECKA